MKTPSRNTVIRTILFMVSALIILYSLPRKSQRSYIYELNRPWAYSLLTAPYDIPINLDSVSAEHVRDSINSTFQPVYKRDAMIEQSAVKAFADTLNRLLVPPTQRNRMVNTLRSIYADGIVSLETQKSIDSGDMPRVRFIQGHRAVSEPTTSFRSAREAYTAIDSLLPGEVYSRAIKAMNMSMYLVPNVVYDSVESSRLYREVMQKAMAPIGIVQEGERIIDRGEKVTPQLYVILKTYEEMSHNRKNGLSTHEVYSVAGQSLFIMILLAALYCYLFYFRRELFENMRAMAFIMFMTVVFAVFAFAMKHTFSLGMHMVPFTIMPIMLLVFFDSRTALFCLMIEAMICSGIADNAFEFIFVQFIAGVTAIYSLKELTNRSQLVRTAILVYLSYCCSYVAIDVIRSGSIDTIDVHMFGAFAINAVLISFAYVLIFVVEKIFGFTSKVTLVELADINNETLRELAEKCPGTFQHSISVSNLAFDAALRIGANAQLVRAGALYHDIGKMNNPAFFTENQHGVNPHDALSPQQSARIVIGHVNDGLKRAEKAKLPHVIRDFISQHHGQGKAKYFYMTYCNEHPDEDVDPQPFTYPGPNPQSRETSILMMADSVEAASRSLKDHSADEIANLVNRIIDSQIVDGLHNDSLLSFKDVKEIKEVFISRLRTIYHSRISYPKEVAKDEEPK
ncbi:MAG: HDIG domain-containing protein [Muribaculaceae bacterium]|nr:HDIG domain-containing protein [Muribaculaceae bacterium]